MNKTMRGCALLVLLAFFSGMAFGQQASGNAAGSEIKITAKRYSFTPGEITLTKGQPVTITLECTDVGHGLRIKELKFNVECKGHSSATGTLTPTKTGEFKGVCSRFCGVGHGSMKMKVNVVEASAQK